MSGPVKPPTFFPPPMTVNVISTPESAVEKLAQAILDNRVRVVQTSARSLAYEIRVTPTAAQLEEIRANQATETHGE